MVKRTKAQPANEKPKVKSTHIQARLHPDKVREVSALEVYHRHRVKKRRTDREIIREALIALGQMEDANWQPQWDVTQIALSADMLSMLNRMARLVETLTKMDFTSVRGHDGVPMDSQAIQTQLSEFDKSASDLLGAAVFFDIEDES